MRTSLALLFIFLGASPLMAQFYSYRGPDGKMFITDRPIKTKGYELQKRYTPPSQREAQRKAAREEKRQEYRRAKKSKPVYKFTLTEKQIDALVDPLAKAYGVDPDLVKAVIQIESSNNYKVMSSKGAIGLMQLIPDTAKRFGISKPLDPHQNVRGGIKYLRWLLAYFEGNVDHTLAAYNAGENAVDRYAGIPPYKETQRYVKKIRKLYTKTEVTYDKSLKHRSKMLRKPKKEIPQMASAE